VTFLEMVKEVSQVGGVAGHTNISSVADLQGEHGRTKKFVQQAYDEICAMHADWMFLWAHDERSVSAALVDPPADLATWNVERFMLDGETLPTLDWSAYTPEDVGPHRPAHAILRPDNKILLHPAPDQAYALAFDYWRRADPLEADGDIPLIPVQFRRAIVGRALWLMGNYEFAEDLMKQGQEMYQFALEQLERHQLPGRQQAHARHEGSPIQVVPE